MTNTLSLSDAYVPNVTVIIPWDMKHEEWLAEAIESVHQSIPIIVRKSKKSPGDALNRAIDLVKTDYFFVLAADDTLHPLCIRHCAEAIGTADFAYPSLHKFGEDDGVFEANIFSVHNMQIKNFIPGVFLGKTAIAKDIRWDAEQAFEDWDFHFRAVHKGHSYVPVPHAIYNYRIHSESLTRRIGVEAQKAELSYEDLRQQVVQGRDYDTYATFYCDGNDASAYVRCILPAKYLPALATRRVAKSGEAKELVRQNPSPISVFQYPANLHQPIISQLRRVGKKILVDVDDDYTSIDLRKTLLRSGRRKLAEYWRRNAAAHVRICKQSDGIICSTFELAERYSKYNSNIQVALNTVEYMDWPDPEEFSDKKIRVGYTLAGPHILDAPIIYDVLKWASEQKNVEVVIIGIDPEWNFLYRFIPYTPSLQVYRDVLSILDIGLAPLQHSKFNLCKSDLKWLEYSMAGAACIAQDYRPYNETLIHNTHGTLVGRKGNWKAELAELIHDKDRRQSYIESSLDYIQKHRRPEHMRDSYVYAIGGAMREELTNVG